LYDIIISNEIERKVYDLIILRVGKGAGCFLIQVEYGRYFDRDRELLKTLPEDKRVFNPISKRWEVAFDQYWTLLELFNGKIRFLTSKDAIDEMFEKVWIHFHKEFKNQITVTSIAHPVPEELMPSRFRIILPEKVRDVEAWCKDNGYDCRIEPTVQTYLNDIKYDHDMNYECELFKGQLYPFQMRGALFLINRKRAILADMTGLGKCPQSVAAASKLIETGEVGKVLVFCPKTIMDQWIDEIEKFTILNSVAVSGSANRRNDLWTMGRQDKDTSFVICNYDLLVREQDREQMMALKPDLIIADEVTAIKNIRAKRTKEMLKIIAPYKFALSATPLENNPMELFSICNWLDESILGPFYKFNKEHLNRNSGNSIQRYTNLDILRVKLLGVMIRRRKDEVSDQLPSIVTETRKIELDKTTRYIYNTITDDTLRALDEVGQLLRRKRDDDDDLGDEEELNPLVLFTLLRQVCDDARLLDTSNSAYAHKMVNKFDMRKTKSNKLDDVMTIVEDVVKSGEKIVLFTGFKRMIDLLTPRLEGLTRWVEISGRIKHDDRGTNRKQFWEDDFTHVLISTDAGRYGQNLQCASYIVNIDIPFNPATLEQRIGRVYRMGSTQQSITVINFMTVDSVEERIMEILDAKLKVFDQVIEGKTVEDMKLNASMLRKLVAPREKSYDKTCGGNVMQLGIELYEDKIARAKKRKTVSKDKGQRKRIDVTLPQSPF